MGLPLDSLLDDFQTTLRARGRAKNTCKKYGQAAAKLIDWAKDAGVNLDIDTIDQRTLERYFADLATKVKPATAANNYRSLRALWSWLVEQDELNAPNPFSKMREPAVPDVPVPVIPAATIKALLDSCDGKDFVDRRDRAIVLVWADVGVRLSEMTSMTVDGYDRDNQVLQVIGKGSRPRPVPIGNGTADALNRYLRARRTHSFADSPALWLGRKGPLTFSGVAQMLTRRPRVRPDAARRMDVGGDGAPLRPLGGSGEGDESASGAVPGRPARAQPAATLSRRHSP
jgi:site-specific recombinase XerC